jgi:ATP-dependent Clp protease ATP-binding subunit ClpB
MDSPNQYTDLARAAIADAQTKAHASSNAQLFPVHVALAIFEDNTGLGRRILIKLGVDEARLGAALRRVLLKLPTQSPAPAKASIHGSGELQSFLDDAARLREDNKDSHVAVDHLLLALYKRRNLAAELEGLGMPQSSLTGCLREMRGTRKVTSAQGEDTYDALSKYAVNLVEQAGEGLLDPVIGRDDEIRRVIQILARRTKNNPVLIGEPGVGKTAIVEGLVRGIGAEGEEQRGIGTEGEMRRDEAKEGV